MLRVAPLLLPMLFLASTLAYAEGSAFLLRGSMAVDDTNGEATDEGEASENVIVIDPDSGGAPLPATETGDATGDEILTGAIPEPETEQDVFALRSYEVPDGGGTASINEVSSKGLSGGGRVVPISRFSERVERVSRLQRSGGTPVDETFDGDTSFDAAEGLRVGTFTLLPELIIRGGGSDNVSQSPDGESGGLFHVEPSLVLRSNWTRHELNARAQGSFTSYSDDEDPDESASVNLGLRLDIQDGLTGTSDLGYSFSQEDSFTAESGGRQVDVHVITGGLGLTRNIGDLAVGGTLGAVRSQYVSSGTGSTAADRNNTLFSSGLRLSSNTGAVLRPFAETDVFLRNFDETCNADCENRNSWGYEMRLGTEIDYGPKFAGDISAGWRSEQLSDSSLSDLSGVVAGTNLVWSPTRRTTVTAGIDTSFETTTIAGSAGSIIYAGDLRLAQEFGDRLVAELGVGYTRRSYEGVDIDEDTYTALAGMTYAFSRYAALQAQYTYRSFSSSQAGSDYVENAIEAGVRFRR